MRHAVRKRVGLAGAGAGNDQQWRDLIESPAAVFDRAALFGIERCEVGSGHARARASQRNTRFR